MPKVTIDGHEIEVEAGTSILNAARRIGGDLVPPAMCYYSKLKGSGGKCRTCLVKIEAMSASNPKPMPKLQASCSTPVADGMVVKNITSPEVLEARKGIVEFLLLNHPLDCPICDQAGECDLQDLSYAHGLSTSRNDFPRRTFDMIDIGSTIELNQNRCILCYRCVYVADQIAGPRVHAVLARGDQCEIGTYIKNSLDSDMIGNIIDVCPVGALTDKTARFKSRVWFQKPMDVHRACDRCSGKAVAWMRGEEIVRVTARRDEWAEVEDWICDRCRFETKEAGAWIFEGPREVKRQSVIGQNHYVELRQLLALTEKHLAARSEAEARASSGYGADPAALISG